MADDQWFGKKDTIITADNIIASKARYEAIEAVKRGIATPDQYKLVADTDRVMAEAMKQRK